MAVKFEISNDKPGKFRLTKIRGDWAVLVRATVVSIAASTVALIATASPAHADDQSYLDELTQSGVPMPNGPSFLLGYGHTVCAKVEHGISPEAIAGKNLGAMTAWGPAIVAAAQHNLCPDTLH
jgi:hypothetical protein